MKQIIVLSTVCVAALLSCKKETTPALATNDIVISQPSVNQSYRQNDSVFVIGTVNGIAKVHGYEVAILNANGDSLYHAHSHTHATKIDIKESWMNTVSGPSALRVIVSSAINHEGDVIVKEIPIIIQQ